MQGGKCEVSDCADLGSERLRGTWWCATHYAEQVCELERNGAIPTLREYAEQCLQKAMLEGADESLEIFGNTMIHLEKMHERVEKHKKSFIKVLDKQTKTALQVASSKRRSTPLVNFLEFHLQERQKNPSDAEYVEKVKVALEEYKILQSDFDVLSSGYLGARILFVIPILKRALDQGVRKARKDRNFKKLHLLFTAVPEDVLELITSIEDPEFVSRLCSMLEFSDRKSTRVISGQITIREYYESIVNRRDAQRQRSLQQLKKEQLQQKVTAVKWKGDDLANAFW